MSAVSFPSDVVDAVCAHMNHDHPEDCLLIVRGLGGHPDAAAAVMVDLDTLGAGFRVQLADGRSAQVRVPFAEPVADRAQVRVGVVQMYHDACSALGVAPRPATEH